MEFLLQNFAKKGSYSGLLKIASALFKKGVIQWEQKEKGVNQ